MHSFFVSRKAQEDLEEIWLYSLVTWSANQADKYLDEIEFCFISLSEKPMIQLRYLIAFLKSNSDNHPIYELSFLLSKRKNNECK